MISTLSLSPRRFRGFRSKERGTRVKDCAKNAASKIAGRFLPSPPSPPLFQFLVLVSFLARQKPQAISPLESLFVVVLLFHLFAAFHFVQHIRAACVASGGVEGRGRKNYPPFTPPPYPVRRLIAGYVHALCECLKQDMHKRIHGTLIRTEEGYYDDEGLTSHKGEAPY